MDLFNILNFRLKAGSWYQTVLNYAQRVYFWLIWLFLKHLKTKGQQQSGPRDSVPYGYPRVPAGTRGTGTSFFKTGTRGTGAGLISADFTYKKWTNSLTNMKFLS